MSSPRSSNGALGSAIAGGALAGVVVGLGEAAIVIAERHLGLDAGLLYFALLAYGGVGALVGLGIGAGLGVVTRVAAPTACGLAGASVLAVLATIIGRFRVFRDVFNETFDGAPLSPLHFQLASAAAALALFVVAFLAWRALARRQPRLASPLAAVGGLIVAVLAARAVMALGAPKELSAPARSAVGQPAKGPNVFLIVVDTLRADHLSCYGAKTNRTPVIDGLAADGTRFGRAYAQASWTRPSFGTIFTSLYPSSHRAIHKSDALPDAVVTLAEVMQGAGYATVGFANNINVAPLFGFQQGFDQYVFLEPEFFFGATESAAQLTIYNQLRLIRERFVSKKKWVENYYQPADVVVKHGLDWIAARDPQRPFFMFLHFMEPHDPYFVHPYNGEAYARVANPNPDPSLAETYRDAYDGAIRFLDGELAKFIAELKAKGLYDDAVILLTADHGEEFHEHGGWWHGTTLYDEQLAVPLIVKAGADAPRGVVSDAAVSSLDVAPTLIRAAGLKVPQAMVGKPLGLAADAPAPRDHAFAESELEGNSLQAYRSGGMKVIHANAGNPRGLPEHQLFDVVADPGEQRDLIAAQTEVANKLTADMSAVQSHAESIAVESTGTSIDAASEERLRALGYVH
ncbi:MAG: sulfatase [Deltaproteobacteria bacterium]|nr:sulfatase [Deltaproteobacteria bacterium]